MKSLQSSRLHENIQSLIKKNYHFSIWGCYTEEKWGETLKNHCFFCKKKLFFFMVSYVLKREKLLIPHYVYFFSIKYLPSSTSTLQFSPSTENASTKFRFFFKAFQHICLPFLKKDET